MLFYFIEIRNIRNIINLSSYWLFSEYPPNWKLFMEISLFYIMGNTLKQSLEVTDVELGDISFSY